jgi:hypothetical protein
VKNAKKGQGWRIVAIGALIMMLGIYDMGIGNFGTTFDLFLIMIGVVILVVGRLMTLKK